MYRILALCCSLGLVLARQSAAPHHDAEHLPNTAFSCRDKVLGGYYADPDAQCQMFHVCVKVAGVGIQDYRFLCPNGTAFDQEAQICAGWADVACEPAALYYSSDNFDLYRIGSGFESKKAPVASEEESDFHLQRAEPDILSGAHSSNFFNNREGKDVQDTQKTGGQSRNQVDQPQRKKVVKKLQRRPTETSFAPSSTQRQITNNFAASFVPTTSRPSPISSSTQASQNRENFNNQYSYQPFKQVSTTLPPSEFDKISASTYISNDYKKTTPQNNIYNRNYNQRYPSTPDYNFNNNDEGNKKSVSNPESRHYNTDNSNNYKSTRQPERRNKQRGQQTYRAQQTSSKVNYNTESTTAHYDKQFPSQYNANANTQKSQQNTQYNFNQETTQKYNKYDSGDDRNNNQETTYQIKYNNPQTTQQTTPKYNQDFKKNYQTQTTQGNSYNNAESQYFEKTKSSPRYDDKITQFSSKQSTPQYNVENSNYQKNTNIPQTPAPKFNTNLLYDNNQQSTPDYYKTDNNREYKTNQSPSFANKQYSSSDYNQNQQKSQGNSQYSTPETSSFNQGISQSQKYQPETIAQAQKFSPSQYPSYNQGASQTTKSYESTNNIQKLPTARASSFNQGTIQSQKSYEPKATPNAQRISTAQPSYFNQDISQSQKITSNIQQTSTPGPFTSANYDKRYEAKSTAAPFKSSNSDDYDDGQYRPELYERESGGEYDLTARNNARKEVSPQVSQDTDVFKSAKQNVRKDVPPQVSQVADVFKSARQNVRKEVPFQAPQESEYLKSIAKNARKEVAPPASQEVEFLKTAHSINIAASGNQLARERRPLPPPSATPAPVSQQQRVTTQSAPRTVQTTPSSRSVYANLAAVTSAAPRPFSLRPEQPSSPPPQQKKFVEAKKSTNSAPSPKAKDVSYDYAYYDNSDPYSEYENIEEFGRTSKKQ